MSKALILVEADLGSGHFYVTSQLVKALHKRNIETCIASTSIAKAGKYFDYDQSAIVNLPGPEFAFSPELGRKTYISPTTQKEYINDNALVEARCNAVLAAYEKFKPDVIIVESYPLLMRYRVNEIQALKAKVGEKFCPFVAFGLEVPATANPAKGVGLLNAQFDHLFVEGSAEHCKLEQVHPEYADITIPVHYPGYFIPMTPSISYDTHSQKIVVTLGGVLREEHEKLLSNIISAIPNSLYKDYEWTICTGRNDATEKIQKLQEVASANKNIHIVEELPNEELRTMMGQAAFVICSAGYSALELTKLQKPFLAFPNGSKEQAIRGKTLTQLGQGVCFNGDISDVNAITQAINTVPIHTRVSTPDIWNGAENMADSIMDIIRGKYSSIRDRQPPAISPHR